MVVGGPKDHLGNFQVNNEGIVRELRTSLSRDISPLMHFMRNLSKAVKCHGKQSLVSDEKNRGSEWGSLKPLLRAHKKVTWKAHVHTDQNSACFWETPIYDHKEVVLGLCTHNCFHLSPQQPSTVLHTWVSGRGGRKGEIHHLLMINVSITAALRVENK